MVTADVKQEVLETLAPATLHPPDVIDLGSSGSDSDDDGERFRVSFSAEHVKKERRVNVLANVLPLGFLDPLPMEPMAIEPISERPGIREVWSQGLEKVGASKETKQFWKAGDYEGKKEVADSGSAPVSMDHVRVHPKFLHSNATSHKWALGALAELLDNSLDEVCSGATHVNVDMLLNKKDGSRMLLVEDNGGGMDPQKMRQCMSLGYSAKSKSANTIGQYGNGFKTSTMRLGADVIVFSRNRGTEGRSPTQTIGLLSYTFLRSTGKEDIVVPMLDYQKTGEEWTKMTRSSIDWETNLETFVKWSPYASESDLREQFNSLSDQGTRVVIYNLWEDDQGELELDFDADEHDIQIRGVNRDEEKIQMAKKFPNSKHFLTYRHSLRSYAAILYLRLPNGFKIILRGKEIKHHSIVSDMMLNQEITYRPTAADGTPKDGNMIAILKIGFVKDAKEHIDVQGFNVYHKNRLIKPFWRVWNAAGSSGRGVIGVLEANFVEPAHDKQGFERTTVLARLEARLISYQKKYWKDNCHKIGYSSRLSKRQRQPEDRDSSPDHEDLSPNSLSRALKSHHSVSVHKKAKVKTTPIGSTAERDNSSERISSPMSIRPEITQNVRKVSKLHPGTNLSDESDMDNDGPNAFHAENCHQNENGHPSISTPPCSEKNGYEEHNANGGVRSGNMAIDRQSKEGAKFNGNGSLSTSNSSLKQLKEENAALKKRLSQLEEERSQKLQIERNKNKSLTDQLKELERKLAEADSEQESLIDIFSEERGRRDQEEEKLRKKLKELTATNQKLLEKIDASGDKLKPEL